MNGKKKCFINCAHTDIGEYLKYGEKKMLMAFSIQHSYIRIEIYTKIFHFLEEFIRTFPHKYSLICLFILYRSSEIAINHIHRHIYREVCFFLGFYLSSVQFFLACFFKAFYFLVFLILFFNYILAQIIVLN